MHRPVREVLAIHSSRELSEWMAYEREFGPLDNEWRDETLSQVHELLQSLVHIEANAHSDGRSPETKPRQHVRASQLWAESMRRSREKED